MKIPEQDVEILRTLAHRVAELAAADENHEKADLWSRLTDLDTSVRPMLLTHLWPLAWSQFLPDESVLRCTHSDALWYERELRQRIWTVETLCDDTVIEPVVRYPHCVTIDRYGGLPTTEKVYAQDDTHQTGAAVFIPIIHEKYDLDKVGAPFVSVDREKREQYRQELKKSLAISWISYQWAFISPPR